MHFFVLLLVNNVLFRFFFVLLIIENYDQIMVNYIIKCKQMSSFHSKSDGKKRVSVIEKNKLLKFFFLIWSNNRSSALVFLYQDKFLFCIKTINHVRKLNIFFYCFSMKAEQNKIIRIFSVLLIYNNSLERKFFF